MNGLLGTWYPRNTGLVKLENLRLQWIDSGSVLRIMPGFFLGWYYSNRTSRSPLEDMSSNPNLESKVSSRGPNDWMGLLFCTCNLQLEFQIGTHVKSIISNSMINVILWKSFLDFAIFGKLIGNYSLCWSKITIYGRDCHYESADLRLH